MWKKLSLVIIFTLSFLIPAEAFAQPRMSEISPPIRAHREGTPSASQEHRLETARNYGLRQIEKRLNSLTHARNHLEQVLRISDEEKTEIFANLDAAYAGLEALKPQIEDAVDVDQLRPLIESIFYDYRIYLVRLPRERGFTAVGIASYVLGNRSQTAITKIEEVVTALEEAGKDVTTLKSLLDEFQGYIEEAGDLIEQARTSFWAMKPAKETTEARNFLDQGREQLRDAREKAHEARKTLAEIRDAINALRSS
jgi:chromosome segregation ATPase